MTSQPKSPTLLLFASGLAWSAAVGCTPQLDDDSDVRLRNDESLAWVGDTTVSVDGQQRSLSSVELIEGEALDVETETWPVGSATRVSAFLRADDGTVEEYPMESAGQGCATFEDPNSAFSCNNEVWRVSVPADHLRTFEGQFWIEAASAMNTVYHSNPPGDFPISVRPAEDSAEPMPTEPDGPSSSGDWVDLSRSDCWDDVGPGGFNDGLAGDFYAKPSGGLGMRWCTTPMPESFELAFEYGLFDNASTDTSALPRDGRFPLYHNSGILFGFPDPYAFGYDNEAWVAVHWGYEVQIDDRGHDDDGPDGLPSHSTGIVYEQPNQSYERPAYSAPGQWRPMLIRVTPRDVQTFVDGRRVASWTRPATPEFRDGVAIGVPTRSGEPRYIGFQAHTNTVGFRNVRYRPL